MDKKFVIFAIDANVSDELIAKAIVREATKHSIAISPITITVITEANMTPVKDEEECKLEQYLSDIAEKIEFGSTNGDTLVPVQKFWASVLKQEPGFSKKSLTRLIDYYNTHGMFQDFVKTHKFERIIRITKQALEIM